MQNPSVEFETHTRDDLMKVCALLAKGIGKETAASRRVQIRISGGYSGGKTAVTDGITAAFADGYQSYKLPPNPLLESYPGEAIEKPKLIRDFNVNGIPCKMSLSRHEFSIRDNLLNRMLSSLFNAPRGRGVDFVTSTHIKRIASDIEIKLNRPDERRYDAKDWTRQWSIIIEDPTLMSPQMEEVFEQLKYFHERRQARRGLQNISGDEPEIGIE